MLLRAELGNVECKITVDDVQVAFTATPTKVRTLAYAMLRTCDKAELQMPR